MTLYMQTVPDIYDHSSKRKRIKNHGAIKNPWAETALKIIIDKWKLTIWVRLLNQWEHMDNHEVIAINKFINKLIYKINNTHSIETRRLKFSEALFMHRYCYFLTHFFTKIQKYKSVDTLILLYKSRNNMVTTSK